MMNRTEAIVAVETAILELARCGGQQYVITHLRELKETLWAGGLSRPKEGE